MQPVRITRQLTDRRGIVLILALGMLTLFTIVAITLASISRTQATAAGNFKRLEQYGSSALTVRDAQVNVLFRYALNQLVYDTRNRQSAIRGHSLLRDMYGSPTRYGFDSAGKLTVQADGAELRLKKGDLQNLLNINPAASPYDHRLDALDYQKVYNGTGIFAPRKIDFTMSPVADRGFTPGIGVTTNLEVDGTSGLSKLNLHLTNREIAAQLAFMNVPSRLMPRAPTNYPQVSNPYSTDWKQILLNPFGPVASSASYWLPLFPMNYTEYDAFLPSPGVITRAATGGSIDPERFTYVDTTGKWTAMTGNHWFGADEDYDYPDINNMFLAMERADGRILIPSFHRPGIIAQVADGVNTLTQYGYDPTNAVQRELIGKLPWLRYNPSATSGNPPADFRGLVLRPRAADRDATTLGVTSPRAGKFREMSDAYIGAVANNQPGQDGLPDDLDGSGFIGDHPSELDVDTEGDGLNDSIWVDLGHPVIQVGDSAVKPLFAFKVVGMDGKINLNVHGNLYKVPTPQAANKAYNWGPTGGINYTIQHKSNLGASPTEINPQYGMILGDNGGPSIYSLTSIRPPAPIWGFVPGTSTIPDPYQRLLEGYTNLYTGDQAPGRWTGTTGNLAGVASSDDNGNLTNPPNLNPGAGQPTVALQESFDTTIGGVGTLTNNYDYSNGSGASPIGTPGVAPAGTPAVHGVFSPVDFYGVGTKFSPFSHSIQGSSTYATAMGLLPTGQGSIVSGYLNYAEVTGSTFGAKLKSLDDGTVPAATRPLPASELPSKGLSAERLLANEPTETNVYNPTDDSLFTVTDIVTLLRADDFDSSANQSRLVNLFPDQMGRRSVDVSGGAQSQTPMYFSSESYGKRRMQNLFTHESWDLIRYNAPPFLHSSSGLDGPGKGLYLGPAVAASNGELLELFGNNLIGISTLNPESYLARSHSGEAGPNLISQLLNYRLPVNAGTEAVTPTTSPYVTARDVYEQLAMAQTIDKKDFLIPYEVQMGRRLDLNRPLTAYKSGSGSAVDLERESFAQQIYVLLALASGACGLDPSGAGSEVMSPQARLAQSRTLAQIAVNIVDYMDPDSVMTMMRFDPDLSDGWDDTSIASAKPIVDPLTGSTIASAGTPEFTSITTVIGFELPQLVINETLAVITEDNSATGMMATPIRDEYLFTWIELFNPWPDMIDPVDNNAGTALVANGEPVFMIQINRMISTNPDTSDPASLPPIAITSVSSAVKQLVMFNGTSVPSTGSSTLTGDGGMASGVGTPRVMGRNGSGSTPGYFVVGPAAAVRSGMKTNTNFSFPTPLSVDYSAAACAFDWRNVGNTTSEPQIDFRLYRKRNPFDSFNALTNPYVVIDSVSQQFQDIQTARPFKERSVDRSIKDGTPSKQATGVYFVKDTTQNPPEFPRPTWATSAANPTIPYVSWQRRQPWHGNNQDWRPYPIGATPLHPFIGKVLAKPSQNLEGAFLGLPSLADPNRYSSSVTGTGYVNKDDTNGMRLNGFIPDTQTFGLTNPKAYKRWEAFPFLNRQLANPLELLSVRLYGSHMWFLPGASAIREWRMRFTDDFEFFPHAWRPESMTPTEPFYERVFRSRQVPWYQDSRVINPTTPQLPFPAALTAPPLGTLTPNEAQLPLPHLYRFFEFVECRSRMNNGIPANQQWIDMTVPSWPAVPAATLLNPKRAAATPTLAATSVLATQRSERTPGKINLNLVTEEEVYRALLDSIETAYYDLVTDDASNQTAYATGGNYVLSVSSKYWPTNYWNALFTPLGQAPLGDYSTGKALDVIDALGRMVAWSSLTLNNSTSITVATPPLATAPLGPISTGGFDLTAYLLFGATVSQTTSPSVLMINASNLAGLISSPLVLNGIGSPNRQFPGIVNGPDLMAKFYPGTDPQYQVHSEMYRAFLLSRSGPDGIHGTADDKPFRSFASDDVSDTILRIRNSATNGLVKEGAVTWDNSAGSLVSPSIADAQALVAKTYVDGADDLVSIAGGMNFYVGDYITRLGGQRIPGLFDPIPDPFSDYVDPTTEASIPHLWAIGADPNDPTKDFHKRLPDLDAGTSSPSKLPVDYWALEERRNELLAKISGNVTTRSHVFAVWVTVGFFRVEPGTEGLKVPLLGAEVGSESGKAFRHRAFFIIDRSQAKSYDPEDIDANFDFDIMRQKKLLEYYKIIE
ncbi:hypothetical protein K2Y11_09415 [bacterium]|nr:hypothetical protein [bacterium]